VSAPGADDGDADLVRRLRRRDEAAFRTLVERHERVVRAYAEGLLRDRHEAEDAAQETFLRAYRRLGAFRGQGTLLGWLLRICRHHCLDRLRTRPAETVALHEDLTVAGAGTPGAAALAVDRERLVAAIGALSEPLQQAYVLRELRGLSYREVADALGVPVGTVRSRLSAAGAELRRRLER
jgi:RNA polymerase sigma-70 factor (ECF subfamily)